MHSLSIRRSLWINHSPVELWEVLDEIHQWPIWAPIFHFPHDLSTSLNRHNSGLESTRGASRKTLSNMQLENVKGLAIGLKMPLNWSRRQSRGPSAEWTNQGHSGEASRSMSNTRQLFEKLASGSHSKKQESSQEQESQNEEVQDSTLDRSISFQLPFGVGAWLGMAGEIVDLQRGQSLTWLGRCFFSKAMWSITLEPSGVGTEIEIRFVTQGLAASMASKFSCSSKIEEIEKLLLLYLQRRMEHVQHSLS